MDPPKTFTMAKKKNNNGVENKNKKNDGGEKKKEDGPSSSRTVKWVKSFQGAESVKSEGQANKLTVVGKVDPTKLRDELATKTKIKVDLVSPQPQKDNKVNKDDANDTKKKQPEKTANDEKPKEASLTTTRMAVEVHCEGCATKVMRLVKSTEGCYAIQLDKQKNLLTVTGSMDVQKLAERLREKLNRPVAIVQSKKKNGGNKDNKGNDGNNDGNDGNDGNGGVGGDEKKKKEDEGNGGGKRKHPSGQSGFGQLSYGKVYRHGYGYQNGALKTGKKMLLLCCEVFGFLVMYNHLAKDTYTNVTLHTHSGGPIKAQGCATLVMYNHLVKGIYTNVTLHTQ